MRYGLLLVCLVPAVLPAQTADPASVAGQVVNAATGEPVRRATVSLRRVDARNRTSGTRAATYGAVTDSDGRFTVKDLEAGSYRLSADKPGFVTQEYGARLPGRTGSILSLSAGQSMANASLRLSPRGVITGRVVDDDGEPVRNAAVQAQRYRYTGPRKQLMSAGNATTNDLGEYRLFDLAPGKYYLAVTFRPAPAMQARGSRVEEQYVTTYYPGVKDAAAAAQLDIAPGAQLRSIDLRLIKTHTVRVRGKIVGGTPEGVQGFQIVLMTPGGATQGTGISRDGEFEFPSVLPGSYTLAAHSQRRGQTWSGRRPLDVGNGNVEDVIVTVTPAVAVTGMVRVENKGAPPAEVQVRLQPFDPANFTFGPYPAANKLGPDGSFRLDNVAADRYSVVVPGLPDGYYVKSVRSGSIDVLSAGLEIGSGAPQPLDVLLNPNAGQVTGAVQMPSGQPTGQTLTVVLIPKERERRLQASGYKTVITDAAGRFTFRNIVPGDYEVFAWEDVESGAWYDPDFLRPFEAKGVGVTVSEGSREDVQVPLIPAD
jgi:protocatechuate 3,4-dioxygenase beta subunit